MEIILIEDVYGLGDKDDIVNVKPGYGRNYLIPQGYAIPASETNRKILAENIRQASHKAEKVRKDAEDIAEQLQGIVLEVHTKASETGKIFGSITNTQLADLLKNKGIEIDRRKISFVQKEIKTLGEYQAVVNLHREVKPELKFKVVAD